MADGHSPIGTIVWTPPLTTAAENYGMAAPIVHFDGAAKSRPLGFACILEITFSSNDRR